MFNKNLIDNCDGVIPLNNIAFQVNRRNITKQNVCYKRSKETQKISETSLYCMTSYCKSNICDFLYNLGLIIGHRYFYFLFIA